MAEEKNKPMRNPNKRMSISVINTQPMKTVTVSLHDLPDAGLMNVIKQEPKLQKELSPRARLAVEILFRRLNEEVIKALHWAFFECHLPGWNERRDDTVD